MPRPRARAPAALPPAPSRADADLHVSEARGGGPVRHVRALAGLALAAVRQPVQPPLLAARDAVERAPEDGRDSGVGRVAQHPAELAALDLTGELRAAAEVEPLLLERTA